MADILDFQVSRSKRSARGSRGQPTSAEIVIFPGIRYERWPEADEQAPSTSQDGREAAASGKPRRDAKQRDMLELLDA